MASLRERHLLEVDQALYQQVLMNWWRCSCYLSWWQGYTSFKLPDKVFGIFHIASTNRPWIPLTGQRRLVNGILERRTHTSIGSSKRLDRLILVVTGYRIRHFNKVAYLGAAMYQEASWSYSPLGRLLPKFSCRIVLMTRSLHRNFMPLCNVPTYDQELTL